MGLACGGQRFLAESGEDRLELIGIRRLGAKPTITERNRLPAARCYKRKLDKCYHEPLL
jgi:hypothetical protein